MKRKLTDTYLRGEKARPKEKRFEIRDGGGLALWVYPTGRRSWVYTYEVGGKKKRKTLGEYPAVSLTDARGLHEADHRLVSAGIDPVEEAARLEAEEQARKDAEEAQHAAEGLAPTVEKLADDYVKRYAKPAKRSWEADERYLEKEVKPILGKLKARDVTRAHIRPLVRRVMDRGSPIAANRLLAVLRKVFSWAVDEGIIEESPCTGLKSPGKKVSKDRVLTPDEVRAVWALLEPPTPRKKDDPPPEGPAVAMSPDVRRALRLILVTAQRPGEVAGMTWEEVEGSWWTIPAERAKNGLSHRVHLSKLALEVLGTRGTGYVFPSPRPKARHIHINALAQAVRLNQKALGVAPWTPHDLRRTAASIMAGAGVAPFTVERVLNHTLQGVQAVYNRHSYDAEKREALNRWAGHLGRILAGKGEQKVVEIGTRRKAAR